MAVNTQRSSQRWPKRSVSVKMLLVSGGKGDGRHAFLDVRDSCAGFVRFRVRVWGFGFKISGSEFMAQSLEILGFQAFGCWELEALGLRRGEAQNPGCCQVQP